MPGALRLLKTAANMLGARVVRSLYFGGVCSSKNKQLTARQLKAAERAARALVG